MGTVSNFDDVGDFQHKFGLRAVNHGGHGPGKIPKELADLRVKRQQEEVDEYIEAYEAGDLAGMFDALIDIVYIALGTAHSFGFPWQEGWDAVQEANMAKERGEAGNSKYGSSYDVLKPEGWTSPDIGAVLEWAGFNLDHPMPIPRDGGITGLNQS